MVLSRRCVLEVLLPLALSTTNVVVVHGFTASPLTSLGRTLHTAATTATTRRNMVMIAPDQLHDVLVQTNHAVITAVSTQFLADASSSAASAAGDGSWWDSFINLFKTALTLVHSVIEGPLRAVGVDQSWGISIAVFTALIRSALVPLSIQQSKSAEYMKALKPYMAEIKQKFKGNEDAQNRAIGKLYEDAKQNPLAGCFVSLVQLPVFLGLYRGVRLLALDNQLNEPFLWIPSLEGPVSAPDFRGLDWLVQGWTSGVDGGLPIPPLGWETTIAFLIMPVVLVVLQSITMQSLQPPVDENLADDEKGQMETTQTVLKFLPLLIGFFSLQVPAGLTIYWFTSNIFTLSQSLAVKAYFAANPPAIELPDYWDSALSGDGENMTPEDRRQASEAGIRVGPSFDDLIDEARFHCLIERKGIRTETAAWQRAANGVDLPNELEAWAKSGSSEPAVVVATESTA